MTDEEKIASIKDVRSLFETAAEKPRRIEKITVPGFGDVHVRGLTAAEYDEFEAGCVVGDGDAKTSRANRPLLLRHCVVTAEGTKVFRDDQIEMLAGLDSWITSPIAAKAMEMCGLGAKAAGDIEKN